MTRNGWGVGKLTLALYPFGAGAVAINVYFAGFIASWIGLPVLSPATSAVLGSALALPATWLFAQHVRKLMDDADAE